jgi:hypothetical protein
VETIKKLISLEQYKSRFNHKTPYIDYGGIITSVTENNWGETPCDYYFTNLNECPFAKIKDNIPLVSGVNMESNNENVIFNNYCFRYKTMVYWYNWINNYGKNSRYYKLCKRGDDYIWRELNYAGEKGDFFDDTYGLGLKSITSFAYIPINNENYSIGTIIEVNSDAEKFNEIFRIEKDETRYELIVLRFIQDVFNNEQIHSNLSIPFIDIPIHLTQTIDNLGLLTSTAKVWEPRKTYMVDDIVLYNGNTYILKNGESYGFTEITGSLNETFIGYIENGGEESLYYKFIDFNTPTDGKTPEEIVYEIEDNKRCRKHIYYTKTGEYYRIFLPYICHKAEINKENGEFIFNTNFWCFNRGNTDNFTVSDSGIILNGELVGENFKTKYVRTTSDSKLTSLRRFKKSVDEDGNILPFILDPYKTTNTELPYTTGIYNVYMGPNDTFRADVMVDISISCDNNSQYFTVSYDGSGQTSIYTYFYKNINEDIESAITLSNNVVLYNIESGNTFLYKWEEVVKSLEKNENIDLIDVLPEAEKKYFQTNYQITSYTEGVMYYITYKCVKYKMQVSYNGTTTGNVYITPSTLMLGDDGLTSSKGVINFTYIKDAFLIYNKDDKTLKNYDYQTGLMYSENYNYEISVASINLTHDKNTETRTHHVYNFYDYELVEDDIISGGFSEDIKKEYNNVGNIYSVTDDNGDIIGYKRLLSDYNFIDIDFDNKIYEVTSTDIENLKKNTILSSIEYTLESITEDDFQKDYVIKDEYTIGLENVSKDINIDIERGLSSSFEKHHILCEIKSLSDLENYRNNLFKI